MNTILVAVDGSEHSKKALGLAADLARQHDSSVLVLHASSKKDASAELRHGLQVEYEAEIEKRLKAMNLRAPLPDETQYARTMISHGNSVARVITDLAGENIVSRAMDYLRNHDVEKRESCIVDEDPADAILSTCKKHQVDTIVLGSRGVNKLQGLVMGSVSQSVLHRADCAVVIVKAAE